MLRHLRRKELGLFSRLSVRVDALDGDADRPERHDEQDRGDGDRDGTHLREHLNEIQLALHGLHPPQREFFN